MKMVTNWKCIKCWGHFQLQKWHIVVFKYLMEALQVGLWLLWSYRDMLTAFSICWVYLSLLLPISFRSITEEYRPRDQVALQESMENRRTDFSILYNKSWCIMSCNIPWSDKRKALTFDKQNKDYEMQIQFILFSRSGFANSILNWFAFKY